MRRARRFLLRHPWSAAAAALVIGHAGFVAAASGDYGITYDEAWHVRHGENVLAWYASGFTDRSFDEHFILRYYGGLFDLAGAVARRLTGGDVHRVRHLLGGLFATLALAGAGRLATRLAGPRAGFFAVLVLLTTPRFFGHACNNPVDVPFAALWVWSVDALVAFVRALPAPGAWRTARLGVLAGLATGVRIGGLLVLGLLGLALVLFWLGRLRRGGGRRPARELAGLAGRGLAVGAVAWAVMMPFWPYFHLDPLRNPARAVRRVSRGSEGTFDVLFHGELVQNDRLPASYVWSWLARVQPEHVAVGLALAVVVAVASLRRGRRRDVLPWALVAAAALLPLVVATVMRPIVYDGVRHFLFALAVLAVPAGAGVAAVLDRRLPRPAAAAGLLVFVVALGPTVWDMARLHPYQAVYFNRTVAGGLGGAAGSFETDYWGASFREGVLWLTRHAAPRPGRRHRVASSCHPEQTRHYLPEDRFEYVGSVDHTPALQDDPYGDPPDFYVATTRWDRHVLYPGDVLHRVARDGVTLLVVVDVHAEALPERRGR